MSTKILVVDDEDDVRLLFKARFRREIRSGDYEFEFASNGEEALEKLAASKDVHLVLSDINMPKMDGLTLTSRISEFERPIRTVIISGYGDMANIRTAMNRGAFDFLTKPLDFQDLSATLVKTIGSLEQALEALEAAELARTLSERVQFVRDTFGRYVTDEVVEALLDSPDGLSLGGETRHVSVLMSDLRGFTPLSERLEAHSVVELLNCYLEAMFEVIAAHGGTVIEILGDGIFALFGAPFALENSARSATRCALDMQRRLAEVNQQLESRGLPQVEMGIGVNSGDAVVGNIGSLKRTKYGAVGSVVNLTARIESLTVGGQVLLSGVAAELAGSDLEVADTQTIRPKGVQGDVVIHDVSGLGDEPGLSLESVEAPPEALREPIDVRLWMIEGGRVSDAVHHGKILGASSREASIALEEGLAPRTNVRLRVRQGGEDLAGEIYGKVSTRQVADGPVLIHLTSVAPEVRRFLDSMRGN
jgi:class 3 adenylate cyclase